MVYRYCGYIGPNYSNDIRKIMGANELETLNYHLNMIVISMPLKSLQHMKNETLLSYIILLLFLSELKQLNLNCYCNYKKNTIGNIKNLKCFQYSFVVSLTSFCWPWIMWRKSFTK